MGYSLLGAVLCSGCSVPGGVLCSVGRSLLGGILCSAECSVPGASCALWGVQSCALWGVQSWERPVLCGVFSLGGVLCFAGCSVLGSILCSAGHSLLWGILCSAGCSVLGAVLRSVEWPGVYRPVVSLTPLCSPHVSRPGQHPLGTWWGQTHPREGQRCSWISWSAADGGQGSGEAV